ncbi:MAG: substrate-binding domain-containing protein [Microcella sp.]|uniref:substrate-binding domain-containing protein n=1 Tax=Microcella sp. TaxID=1913979 RepID=UPI003314D1BD
MRKKLKISVASAAAMALLLAGCSNAMDTPDEQGSPESPDINALFIPYNTGNPYFDRLGFGMEEEAEILGGSYSTDGPAVAGPTAQLPFIADGLARGVNVIGIYANDPAAMTPQLSAARADGVAILALGADIEAAARDAAILATDNDLVGPALVDVMAEEINFAGQIAILSGTPESPDHTYWIAGIEEYLKDPKFSDIEVVEIAYGNDVPEQALGEANALLTKYPDLAGIIGVTTVAVSQAAQAVSTANLSGDVAVTGLGLPNQMTPYLEDGTVNEFLLWDPADMGRIASCLGDAIISGTIVAEPGAEFDCGEFGSRVILDDGSVIAGDLISFTAANVAEFDF